jgi:hypothetical protein
MFLSCSRKNIFNFTQNAEQIRGECIPVDCFIGIPYSITCIDTLLFFYDRHEKETVTIFDIKNNRCVGRAVPEGKGPEEVTVPLDIFSFPQENELYVFQRQTGCMNSFSIPEMKMQRKVVFQERPSYMQKMRDYYVGIGLFKTGRFGIYDLEGKMLRSEGKYPFRGEDMDRVSNYILYQGHYCANPNENYFVIANLLCNNIEFYEVKEIETVLLRQYDFFDIKAQYREQLIIDNDCIINYTWAYGTVKYCYMLYSGKTYSENDQRTSWGNKIIVFDWNGNYVKTMETDREILTFCVDELTHQIYATIIDNNGEYGIMRFKM